MKLLYQQVLLFFVVIVLTIVLTGLSFVKLGQSYIYNSNWTNLERYSDTLVQQSLEISKDSNNNISFNTAPLKVSESLLTSSDIHFSVYNTDGVAIYPKHSYSPKITQEEWSHLKKDKMVKKVVNSDSKLPNGEVILPMIEVIKPYYYNKKLVAAVVTGMYISNIDKSIKYFNFSLIRGFSVALIVSMIISFFVAHKFHERLNMISKGTMEVSKGNYGIRLHPTRIDEIGQLKLDFNRMAAALEKSDQEIDRQEERRQEFLADAAHEMRTPLTTISGILEGIKYDVIPAEARDQSIDLMYSETQRLIRLVNKNLDYEKIRTNTMPLDRTVFDVNKAIKSIIRQCANKAQEANDELVPDLPDELLIDADYDRLVQVIFNIVSNAIQFTSDGTVTISGCRDNNITSISVADTGIGMTEDQLKNIFERYYKADPSRKRGKYGESGLGLAISYQIIKQHGGQIEVQSEYGKGTVFTISIPDRNQPSIKAKPRITV